MLARRPAVVLVALGILGSALLGGCSSHRDARGFCATIRRGHLAFDPNFNAPASRAFVAFDVFDRIAASAPGTVGRDLKIVGSYFRSYLADPVAVSKGSAGFDRYVAATRRVDRYLHDTCGLTIPMRPA